MMEITSTTTAAGRAPQAAQTGQAAPLGQAAQAGRAAQAAQVAQVQAPRDAFAALGGEDFLRLLIMQLTNQDPLEPTSNEDLIKQMASIRDIEVSTTLADTLRELTEHQRFGSVSSLIGQYVQSRPDDDGQTVSGKVAAVRFGADGSAVLELDDGRQLSADQVEGVETPLRAAQRLIGRMVSGVVQTGLGLTRQVQGVVTAAGQDEAGAGRVYLELDTGDRVFLEDVLEVGPALAGAA